MTSQGVIEGTGEEIAEIALHLPREHFKLISLESSEDGTQSWADPDAETWNEVMGFIHS